MRYTAVIYSVYCMFIYMLVYLHIYMLRQSPLDLDFSTPDPKGYSYYSIRLHAIFFV